MSSRKPGYVIRLTLLAIILNLPHMSFCVWAAPFVLGCVLAGPFAARNPLLERLGIPGLGGTHEYGNTLTWAPFWHDQFIYHANAIYDGSSVWRFSGIDPESGKSNEFGFRWPGPGGSLPRVYGDRLFLASHPFEKRPSAEVIDGTAQQSDYVDPQRSVPQGKMFLLDGEPARIEYFVRGFVVSRIRAGVWTKTDSVVLPDNSHDWTFGPTKINFQRVSEINCFNQGDQIHVLLNVDGSLLYRCGLDLKPFGATDGSIPTTDSTKTNVGNPPATAPKSEDANAQIAGWSLVRGSIESSETSSAVQATIPVDGGLIVDGKPASLIVGQSQPGYTVGSVYRFDGNHWSLFATERFPFGATRFRTVACGNAQRSYIVATTTLGVGHVYAVDSKGIRPTNGAVSPPFWGLKNLSVIPWIPAIALGCGMFLGLGTWCLMMEYTKPDYEFATRTVKLGSLGRRGLARLIDLTLVFFTTAVLSWALTRGFDWFSLAEALNLHTDHPTIHAASRVIWILGVWLAFLISMLIVIQGRSGVTPGKWCCGLRTLRKTLRPCGFARSLAREFVMCVDTCNFLCWTPGILCIAFSDRRQRLGDLVADTIVIQSRSFASRSNAAYDSN